jgi:lysophospholipase L1-like esterase
MRPQFHRLCLLLAIVSSGFVAPLIAADTPAATPPATAPSPHSGIRLLLPPVIYAVPGIEANLYFENVCLMVNPKNYVFDVDAPRGHQEAERWTYLPTDKDIGDYRLTLTIRDENNAVVATTSTIVRVTPADAGADQPLSLLCIGDSLTNASVYPQRILEASERPANPKLTLIGTHGPGSGAANGPVKHEGYGGWTALRFATHFTDTARTGDAAKRGSPFLYAQPTGAPKLDFTRYCADVNGGKFPDRVTIFLGPNDLFSYQDETIDAAAEKMLSHYDQIVEMVRTSSPATRLGLMLPVPPTSSQDAFGNNYGNGQTRWQYKRNMHRLVEKMQERYGKREAENIDLVPTHINLDCDHNYPTSEALANAWATDKITRQNNSVHPAASGYKQIGDSVYCWLKATAVKPAAAK